MPVYTEDIAQGNTLQSIAVSFDRTIQSGREGINQYRTLPKAITNHPAYPQYLKNQSARDQDSGRKEIVEFLAPQREMKFVDLGCCLNLIDNGYSLWPSEYYGVDISSEVMQELDNFLRKNGLEVGGLYHCGIHQVPVPENFFDIGACIGSLEYFRSTYIVRSLNEFHRILKPGAKFVLDIPNPCSKEYRLSQKIESYLGRGDEFDLTVADFERLLQGRFTIVRRDALGMFQYFLICCK
jgi:SAM-dependent methyltransferase